MNVNEMPPRVRSFLTICVPFLRIPDCFKNFFAGLLAHAIFFRPGTSIYAKPL